MFKRGKRSERPPAAERPGSAAGKEFRLSAADIRSISPGHGHCLASDRITVDGEPVGYAYREKPDDATDSGWRFFAGDESQGYADTPSNFEVYDVNTIANYDNDIVAILDAPPEAQFERVAPGQPLSRIQPTT
jgi:hypothetical protein